MSRKKIKLWLEITAILQHICKRNFLSKHFIFVTECKTIEQKIHLVKK